MKQPILSFALFISFVFILTNGYSQETPVKALDTEVTKIVNEAITQKAFPGCRVLVAHKGKVVYDKCFGNLDYEHNRKVTPNTIYDLASLSKTSGTLMAVMKLYDQKKITLDDKIYNYLPFFKGSDKENITLREILFHESGMPASLPFYKAVIDNNSYKGPLFTAKKDIHHQWQVEKNYYMSSEFKYKQGLVTEKPDATHTLHVADDFYIDKSVYPDYMNMIRDAKRTRPAKYVYSCVNFIMLKEMVEHITGEPMDVFLEREFYAPMGLTHTRYLPLRKYRKTDIAPTSVDGILRKGILQGYVHDESAAFFGGISGNAGLFSTAGDIARLYQMLLNNGTLDGKRYLSEKTCKVFTTQTSKISRRGLGWDKPDKRGGNYSPCSDSTPISVYGHTGFTGTCTWVDPDNQMIYVFLCNRTYPHSWNGLLSKLSIRSRLQEVIYKKYLDKVK